MAEFDKVIFDNTVISNFALVERVDLLQIAVDGKGVTSEEVVKELNEGVRIGKLPNNDLSSIPIVKLENIKEQDTFSGINRQLGSGESSCLSIAIHRGYKLFSDDSDARERAIRAGVSVSGTLGILFILVKKGIVSLEEGDSLLQKMIQFGYFSPVKSLKELM